MSRFDDIGLFWEDLPSSRKRGERVLGPLPEIPETGWRPPTELPDWSRAPVMSFDVETYDPELDDHGPGWARGKGHIVGMSLAVPGQRIYVPIRHEVQSEMNLDPDSSLRWFDYHLKQACPKIGAHLQYDVGWCREEGVTVNGKLYDVQLAQSLLDENSKVGLEALGQRYCGVGKDTDLLEEWCRNYYGTGKKNWRKDIYRAPVTLVGSYGEQDASLPLDVMEKMWPLLQADGVMDLFEMECALTPLLIDMRYKGVSIDIPYAERLRDTLKERERDVQATLDSLAGTSINVNSGNDLARAFDKAGLSYPRTAPTVGNPKGNPSFVKEFLENHPHELPQLVTRVRGLAKLNGTFVEGYLLGSNVNGKIHGSFHQTKSDKGGALTGRLASSDPNLQNIPTRSAEGKLIRKAFIAEFDEWWKFDYSQIEYRLLAHFAVGEGSDLIRQAYLDDPRTDYHQSTADLIEKITGIKLERSQTKNINFGIAYGMGLVKLAKDLNVSMAKAKELMDAYHAGVPFAKATMDKLSEFAQLHGYNTTILGRRTHFNTWEPAGWGVHGTPLPYHAALREYGTNITRAWLYRTLNYTLQGSSADMMKAAMVKCYQDGIFNITGVPRLTVHDELDFDVENTRAVREAFREMHHIMQTVIPLRVPVICDLEKGLNWGDVETRTIDEPLLPAA